MKNKKDSKIKNAASKIAQLDKEKFIALVKESAPEAYQAAVENGWVDRIIKELGVGKMKPGK